MKLKRSLLLTTTFVLAACGTQVDGTDRGLALASVHGTLTSARTITPAEADVSLAWVVTAPSGGDYALGVTVPVTGSFPASFEVNVYEPPPALALNDYGLDGEAHVGVAYILATDREIFDGAPGPGMLGASPDHVLVYVDAAVVPGSRVHDEMFHTPLTVGYHLMRLVPRTAAELAAINTCRDGISMDLSGDAYEAAVRACGSTFDQFQPAAGESVSIEMTDDSLDVVLPNWT